MVDRRKIPNTQLRAVRDGECQMSRHEFARHIVVTGAAMGETVGCTARLGAAWEDGEVRLPPRGLPAHLHTDDWPNHGRTRLLHWHTRRGVCVGHCGGRTGTNGSAPN